LGRFNQVGVSSGVSLDSGSVVVPKLSWMSGALSSVVWFLGSVSIQKTRRALGFFLSSSNRNRGKTFAILSKKMTPVPIATGPAGAWDTGATTLSLFPIGTGTEIIR
jgi:hypothetical protein